MSQGDLRFTTAREGAVQVNWSTWIRRVHRWLSIAFTLAVIANLVALARHTQALWIGLLALFPLILLLASGLYLFVLPYVTKWRARGRIGRAAVSS